MKRTVFENIERMRAMSVKEWGQRMALEIRKVRWRRQAQRGGLQGSVPVGVTLPSIPFSISIPTDDAAERALLAEAEGYLRHEWRFFGLNGLCEDPIGWHTDPISGNSAPMRFGLDIDYRDSENLGNAKIIWEKNRHHHFTVLARAYSLTRDERFAKEVATQLTEWPRCNPYRMGMNWTHALEAGIRLISWVWCERLLRGSAHHDRVFGATSPLWSVIHQHQQFISQTYSRGSSANNHLIGEMAGLFVAATAWPFFRESTRWQARARESLEREIIRQTFSCGLNREMGFGYHLFTWELFWVAWWEAWRANTPLSPLYQDQLQRMDATAAWLTDVGGNLPNYGDGDDGRALQLWDSGARRDDQLRRWQRQHLGAPADAVSTDEAGLFVLTSRRGTPREVFVLADAGNHGFLSIAAHAHADALAFTLSVGGHPVLVDAGTFDYFGSDNWRAYFRSTQAHNTAMVEGLDSSVPGGPFLWTQQARATVERWQSDASGMELVASHDGYRRMGVIHRRRWELKGDALRVVDTFEGDGEREILLCFHAAPECRVEPLEPNLLSLKRPGVRVILRVPEGVEVKQGWYSAQFGVKKETTTIQARWRGGLPVSLTTVLEIQHED